MANPQYSFLNEYLKKVNDDSTKIDPNTDMEDDNDFYNTQPDEPEAEENIQYGTSDSENDQQIESSEEEQANADGDVLDYILGDNDPYDSVGYGDDEETDTESESSNGDPVVSPQGGNNGSLAKKISGNESQGKYTAFNSKGGGSGAVGKYQFRWNIWKDSIQKVTGVKSKEDFLHSPKAQEKYFAWYEKHYLRPAAEKLVPYNKMNLNMDQLQQLVHFRGEGGAKKYLQGKLKDKPESYNVPISKYIARHQAGGPVVANSSSAQFNGLNNSSFSEMIFPMEGTNTFRGLDNGDPVYLEDEEGKKEVLKGKKHTTRMTGKVYEKRLNK